VLFLPLGCFGPYCRLCFRSVNDPRSPRWRRPIPVARMQETTCGERGSRAAKPFIGAKRKPLTLSEPQVTFRQAMGRSAGFTSRFSWSAPGGLGVVFGPLTPDHQMVPAENSRLS